MCAFLLVDKPLAMRPGSTERQHSSGVADDATPDRVDGSHRPSVMATGSKLGQCSTRSPGLPCCTRHASGAQVVARVAALIGLITVVVGMRAGVASASTAKAEEGRAQYVAAPGEHNQVTLSNVSDSMMRIVDRGAVIAVGPGCNSVDAHTADCTSQYYLTVYVWTGDMDDVVTIHATANAEHARDYAVYGGVGDDILRRDGPLPRGHLNVLEGGPGSDQLHGGVGDDDRGIDYLGGGRGSDRLYGRGSNDRLNGGPGSDQLYGGSGNDELGDGDTGRKRSPDLLDGGSGHDAVSYRKRVNSVNVDLSRQSGGEFREDDRIIDIEKVVGGRGNDRLSGDSGDNKLLGGPGDDRLRGFAGNDTLRGMAGNDQLFGSAGRDRLAGGHWNSCGAAADTVRWPTKRALVRADCELVAFHGFIREDSDGLGLYNYENARFRAYPGWVAGRRLGLGMRCPWWSGFGGEYQVSPNGVVRVQSRQGLVAMGEITDRQRRCSGWPRRPTVLEIRVHLTRLGKRLTSRPSGVLTTVRISGTNLPTAAWTIRLKAP